MNIKNIYRVTISFVLVLFLSNTATAKFIGLTVENITDNDDGLSEYAIYATFDDPTDLLNGVFNANIYSTTGFFHNSIDGMGQSALPFTAEQTSMSDNPDADSFVTVGLMTGDNNEAWLDLWFDEDAFINGTSLGKNAGWFQGFPPGDEGLPDQNGLVLIAVFTPLNDMDGLEGIVSGELTVGYSAGGEAKSGTATFITPTPGTLGLFAMVVFIGKRRRRN